MADAPLSGPPKAEAQGLLRCDFGDFERSLLPSDPGSHERGGLLSAALRLMFETPLPPGWAEHVDEPNSRIYFFNALTGESSWAHPQEALFRELIEEVSTWRPDFPVRCVCALRDAHLTAARDQATQTMASWSTCLAQETDRAEPTKYFFNSVTQESTWQDPRESVEFALWQRGAILSGCVDYHAAQLEEDASDQRPSTSASLRRPSLPPLAVLTSDHASSPLAGSALPPTPGGASMLAPAVPASSPHAAVATPPAGAPQRWLRHARDANSQLHCENGELRALVAMARALTDRLLALKGAAPEGQEEARAAERQALRSERNALRARAEKCMLRPVTVLSLPPQLGGG
eukprot:TRINITY_DN55420_c0_g1_i1.p1 TRINITY_DN55420_c0_g1~~TRINITY_DN55420_c0_g1_i1.p1  ORF type:complete len:360 (+),score=90.97 TRINITY_DN55420_c0_g1_i1:40-1080(+)